MLLLVSIENSKNLKYYIFFKKHQFFILYPESLKMINEKIFKEEESIKILKVLGLI